MRSIARCVSMLAIGSVARAVDLAVVSTLEPDAPHDPAPIASLAIDTLAGLGRQVFPVDYSHAGIVGEGRLTECDQRE